MSICWDRCGRGEENKRRNNIRAGTLLYQLLPNSQAFSCLYIKTIEHNWIEIYKIQQFDNRWCSRTPKKHHPSRTTRRSPGEHLLRSGSTSRPCVCRSRSKEGQDMTFLTWFVKNQSVRMIIESSNGNRQGNLLGINHWKEGAFGVWARVGGLWEATKMKL